MSKNIKKNYNRKFSRRNHDTQKDDIVEFKLKKFKWAVDLINEPYIISRVVRSD